jgi:hypothetical protein
MADGALVPALLFLLEPQWVREAAGLTLRGESGKDERGAVVGIPYGSVARIVPAVAKA